MQPITSTNNFPESSTNFPESPPASSSSSQTSHSSRTTSKEKSNDSDRETREARRNQPIHIPTRTRSASETDLKNYVRVPVRDTEPEFFSRPPTEERGDSASRRAARQRKQPKQYYNPVRVVGNTVYCQPYKAMGSRRYVPGSYIRTERPTYSYAQRRNDNVYGASITSPRNPYKKMPSDGRRGTPHYSPRDNSGSQRATPVNSTVRPQFITPPPAAQIPLAVDHDEHSHTDSSSGLITDWAHSPLIASSGVRINNLQTLGMFTMRVVLSLLILAFACFMIIYIYSRDSGDIQITVWVSIITAILGYWMPTPKFPKAKLSPVHDPDVPDNHEAVRKDNSLPTISPPLPVTTTSVRGDENV